MRWDPATYLEFADLRMRPGIELLSRIPDLDAKTVVDLGCGTGHLTSLLTIRWHDATVIGVDSSSEMLERAEADHPSIDWVCADIEHWEPSTPPDVVYSNAALHWIDDHEALFRRIRSWLAPGGTIAVQMPNNWHAPTHTVPDEILDAEEWSEAARLALLRNRVAEAQSYVEWLQPAICDIWETTYYQLLEGDDPVLAWVRGSVLKPVLDVLSSTDRERFLDRCRRRYAAEYPPTVHGVTILPFRRLFAVATDIRT